MPDIEFIGFTDANIYQIVEKTMLNHACAGVNFLV